MGRSLYRGLTARRRIEEESRDIVFASARIVGLTKRVDMSEGNGIRYHRIVAYETPESEVIWAETQPHQDDVYTLNSSVEIMYVPERPRAAWIIPYKDFSQTIIGFEKNLPLLFPVFGICSLCGMIFYSNGLAMNIFGPFFVMLSIGYTFGYLTKARSAREERDIAAKIYQELHDRLVTAQECGVIPCRIDA